MSDERKGGVAQVVVLVIALLLLVVSFALSAVGLLSPSWQVVDIREFRAEHHHGLWQDCTRPERQIASLSKIEQFADGQPLHCTYKFDISASRVIEENIEDMDQNAAATESEHHQFFGWQKAVLVFIILSMLLVALALCCGLCAPCHSACAVIFTIFVFLALFFAIVGDCVFFFAAHRVDSRFVRGLVGTYEQNIGYAFYMHLSGTALLLLALIVSLIATYQMLRNGHESSRGGFPIRELAPLYGQQRLRETRA